RSILRKLARQKGGDPCAPRGARRGDDRFPRKAFLASLILACQSLPSTLGLACEEHENCEPGQQCIDSHCVLPPSDAAPPYPAWEPSMTDGEGANGRDELEPVTCGLAADGCEALDILVVLDNSGSIHPETEELLIPRFGTVLRLDFGELLRQTCRYHLGVTSTEPSLDPQAPADCRVRGALNRRAVGDTSRDCFGDI